MISLLGGVIESCVVLEFFCLELGGYVCYQLVLLVDKELLSDVGLLQLLVSGQKLLDLGV